ncbi:MAG: hypothetical protein ACMUJM_10570 [bacterium]
MKQYVKIFSCICCFLLISTFVALHADAYEPVASEVVFGLVAEDIVTSNGPCRRVNFNLKKGPTANPVSVSVTIKYDRTVYNAVGEQDIKASPNLNNKTLSTRFDPKKPDVIGVVVGLENFNTEILPEGYLFYVDLVTLPNVTPGSDSIYLSGNYADDGPNQACTADGSDLTVLSESGVTFNNGNSVATVDESGGSSPRTCFINALE